MTRTASRPARWNAAVSDAQDAIARLLEVQEEYLEWRNSIPENLEDTPVVEKLDVICELWIGAAQDLMNECEGLDFPLGFGND